jgi:hypothetical protein
MTMKRLILIFLLVATSASQIQAISGINCFRILNIVSGAEQSPFTFMNAVPERVKLNSGIDLSFFVNKSIVFQYRYKLEVPKNENAKFESGLINWSGWISNDINDLKIQRISGAGKYKLIIEYKVHSDAGIKIFEKTFEVYQVEAKSSTVQPAKQNETKRAEGTNIVITTAPSVNPKTETKQEPAPVISKVSQENVRQENVNAVTVQQQAAPVSNNLNQVSENDNKANEASNIREERIEINNANDRIIKKDGTEIRSKVIEIYSDLIAYKESGIPNAPVRTISIPIVSRIIYENGEEKIFNGPEQITEVQNQQAVQKVVAEPEQQDTFENADKKSDYKGNYFLIGIGYGNSYGGAGVMAQLRLGGKVGVGIHAGVGYFPNAPVLAAGGIKFFPYKNFYVDAQFGLNGWEYYSEVIITTNPYSIETYSDEHLLYGPSVLIGGDWNWGRKVGIGFNAGAGVTYYINAENFSHLTVALDIGFIIRF